MKSADLCHDDTLSALEFKGRFLLLSSLCRVLLDDTDDALAETLTHEAHDPVTQEKLNPSVKYAVELCSAHRNK